jgi:hypothetical protein
MTDITAVQLPAEESKCEHCGSTIVPGEGYTVDCEFWCETCGDDASRECERCGDRTADSLKEVDGDMWCSDCVALHSWNCDGCNEPHRNSSSVYSVNGEGAYCEYSVENYDYCEDCDTYHPDSCPNATSLSSARTKIYSTPIGVGPIYYGVELEVECVRDRETCAEKTRDLFSPEFVLLKEDGSLNDGFEIVTRPASYDEHRKNWANFWKSTPRDLRSYETETCGMHVHVSRAPLSALTILKIDAFSNENAEFTEKLARRSCFRWARIEKKDKFSDYGKRDEDLRYRALNLQNRETIEFRIFRGTLVEQSFYRNLEIVVALVAYCQQAGLRELTPADWITWLDKRRKMYPALTAWLCEEKLLTAKKEKKYVSTSV